MKALIEYKGEKIIADIMCRFENKKKGVYYRLSFTINNASYIVHRNENEIKKMREVTDELDKNEDNKPQSRADITVGAIRRRRLLALKLIRSTNVCLTTNVSAEH